MTGTFQDLGVDAALADALAARGITSPFPIQERSIPMALTGGDVIGQARTGTGKTLAFGLPLLHRLDPALKRTQALVVVPTRELCIQVADELGIGAARGLSSLAIYGGVPYEDQVEAVRGGVQVVVGTPGRTLDLLQRGDLDLSNVTELVLDEADEMLDMGFLPDVERLIEACRPERHTMLFSATMPTEVVRMARRYLASPTFVRAEHEVVTTAPLVTQHFLQVHRLDKPRILARVLQSPGRGSVYVFVRTKMKADRLVEELEDLGVEAIAIHGDLRQTTRERNLDRFRSGKATVLVATEVAARGLDVEGVTHVVNFDCPEDEKMYLHRIGRTARAGQAGVAVTFCEHNEVERLNVIRRAVGQDDNPIEEVFSTSPALLERFGLPEETPWERRAPSRPREGARGGARDGERGTGERGGSRGGERSSGGRGTGRSDRDGGRGTATARGTATEAVAEATDPAPIADADDGTRDDRAPSGRTRTRRRTRGEGATRAAASDATTAEVAPAASDGPSEPAGDGASDAAERPRTRARRGGRRGGAGGGRTPAAEREATEREVTERDGEPSARRRGDGGGGPARGERARGDGEPQGRRRSGGRSGGRSAGRSGGDAGERSSGAGDGQGRRRDATTGGAKASGSGSGSGRSRGSGSGSGSGSERSRGSGSGRSGTGRSGGSTKRAAVDGEVARGEGQPQLVRRVRVDHLP